jgi:hypothetical protein
VSYPLHLNEFARHQLLTLPGAAVDALLDCFNEIGDDPHRDPHLRVTLVVPLYRIFPDAYLCGLWAIAYMIVEDLHVVVVEAVGQTFYR